MKLNHLDSRSAKAWASKRRLGRMKHVTLKSKYVQDEVEKKLTDLHTLKRSRTKQIWSQSVTQPIETRLKQIREGTEQREDETKRGKHEKKSISGDEEEMRT